MQGLTASLISVNQTVADAPSPTPYLSLLDPAVAAYNALPNPPGDVLSGAQATFDDVVGTIGAVRVPVQTQGGRFADCIQPNSIPVHREWPLGSCAATSIFCSPSCNMETVVCIPHVTDIIYKQPHQIRER